MKQRQKIYKCLCFMCTNSIWWFSYDSNIVAFLIFSYNLKLWKLGKGCILNQLGPTAGRDAWQEVDEVDVEELQQFTKEDCTRKGIKNIVEAVRRLFLTWEKCHVALLDADGYCITAHLVTDVGKPHRICEAGYHFKLADVLVSAESFFLQASWGTGRSF